MAEADFGGLSSSYRREDGVSRKKKIAVDEEPGPSAIPAPNTSATHGHGDGGQGGTFGGKDANFDPLRFSSAVLKLKGIVGASQFFDQV
ncbi:hypothetical protein B296_00018039 [Ensete ventricosum]|uniref:Uncharacterized protein n=1 Tax=Ensete ventricosum TaxID=4639 RepID=A0A427B2P2_ENSVE|nr:hypothetical protein B296_00018039 [Ensete ventricosum]